MGARRSSTPGKILVKKPREVELGSVAASKKLAFPLTPAPTPGPGLGLGQPCPASPVHCMGPALQQSDAPLLTHRTDIPTLVKHTETLRAEQGNAQPFLPQGLIPAGHPKFWPPQACSFKEKAVTDPLLHGSSRALPWVTHILHRAGPFALPPPWVPKILHSPPNHPGMAPILLPSSQHPPAGGWCSPRCLSSYQGINMV